MTSAKRYLRAFLPLIFLAPLCAQQGDTFRSQSNLVLIPVEVRKHNQHVSGLDKDKFTILQDGKPQKVAVFDEVRTTTERLKKVAVGPQEFSNQYTGNPAAARYTIIAIDRINTTTMDMQRVRMGLMKFLTQVAESGEPIRLIAINPSTIEMLQDFTTDPKVLAMALQRNKTSAGRPTENSTQLNEGIQEIEEELLNIPSESSASAHVAERLDKLEDTKSQEQDMLAFQQRNLRINSLEALQMVAQSLAGLPGRKSLVWASSGYPFAVTVHAGIHSTTQNFSQVNEATALDEYTMHLLNSANIAVYPVDARGTVNTAFEVMDPSHKYSATTGEKEAARMNDQETITTFEHLADATGGNACFDRADLSGCFKDAIDDSRDYYMVGFYADTGTKPGWHKLQVKVAAAGSVRSRTGYTYTKLNPAETAKDDLRLQLSSLLSDPSLPFFGRWDIKGAKGDKKTIGFEVKIMPEAKLVTENDPHLNFDVVAVARAKDGSLAAQFAQKVDRQMPPAAVSTISGEGIVYKNEMPLPVGAYLVRIVVRDNNTGRMGSASTFVKVD